MTNPPDPEAESVRLELQEAIVTFRHQISLLVQISGFMATADSVLIAYGFSQKVSGILLVASAMPVIMLVSYGEIMHSTRPLIYVAMALERKLQLRDAPLAALYARTYPVGISNAASKSIGLTELEARESILGIPRLSWLHSRPGYVLGSIFILQIGLFFVGLLVYHYRFM